MPRIFMKAALGASALLLGASLALADTNLDPMQALRGRPAGSNALDPMTAYNSAIFSTKEKVEGNADFEGLPDGPGAEETYYQCVACHSAEIIKQQRVTDLRWDELWNWMANSQGMVEPDEETKAIILAYLKQHFSSER